MPKVFISYARDESHGQNLATECQKELQTAGFEVFRDVIGLKPGDVWYSKLEFELETSDVVVLIVSEKVRRSKWVHNEISMAEEAGLPVIPVFAEEVRSPLWLRHLQALNFAVATDWPLLIESISSHGAHNTQQSGVSLPNKASTELDKTDIEVLEMVDNLKYLGDKYKYEEKFEDATEAYGNILSLVTNDPITEEFAYKNISEIYQQQGKYSEAIELLQKSLKINEELDRPREVASNYNSIAQTYRQLGRIDEATELLKKSLKINTEFGWQEGVASNHYSLGEISLRRGALDQAAVFFSQAFHVYEQLRYMHEQANCISSLGNIAQQRINFGQAEEFYRQAHEIYQQLGDDRAQALSYGNLGEVAKQQGDLDQAEVFYRQAHEIYHQLGDDRAQALSYGCLGEVAKQQGNYDQAEVFYRQAHEIYEQLGDAVAQALSYGNLGEIVQQRGDLYQAEEFFMEALKINDSLGQKGNTTKLLKNLNKLRKKIDNTIIRKKIEEVHISFPPTFPCAWAAEWGQDQHGLWQAFNYQGVFHAFRWIQPGSFLMGSPNNEDGRYDREDQHHVTLSRGFWLAETPVTKKLWDVVMQDNSPSSIKGGQLPVVTVSWNNCQNFLQKINLFHSDFRFSLPWEAIWEYACRAGTTTAFSFGNKEDLNVEHVNYSGQWSDFQSNAKIKPVKTYPPNDWGLYEMHGNVFEWCQDIWQENLGTEAVIDPYQEVKGDQSIRRVIRGGACGSKGKICRAAFRSGHVQDNRHANLGFRLALLQ